MLTQQAPYTLNQLSNSTFTLIGFYGVCLHYQTKKPGFRAITSCELKLQNQNCDTKKKSWSIHTDFISALPGMATRWQQDPSPHLCPH